MTSLSIQIDAGRTGFGPGEHLQGQVAWQLDDHPIDALELRLIWFTRGKGTQDVAVVDHRSIPAGGLHGQQRFDFPLPDGPYSFSGPLISLVWALELLAQRGKQTQQVEFVLGPQGHEVLLGEPAAAKP